MTEEEVRFWQKYSWISQSFGRVLKKFTALYLLFICDISFCSPFHRIERLPCGPRRDSRSLFLLGSSVTTMERCSKSDPTHGTKVSQNFTIVGDILYRFSVFLCIKINDYLCLEVYHSPSGCILRSTFIQDQVTKNSDSRLYICPYGSPYLKGIEFFIQKQRTEQFHIRVIVIRFWVSTILVAQNLNNSIITRDI